MSFSEDMKRLAKDAIADVGNTYRAVLLQDTGWPIPGVTQEQQDFYNAQNRSTEIAKESISKDIDLTPQQEPEPGEYLLNPVRGRTPPVGSI
jgi:hypothetical protein